MCEDLFDNPIEFGIMLAIAEEMSIEDRELEKELQPFDPDSQEEDDFIDR